MPIRGHSGVQGGAEVGCTPTLDEAQRQRFEEIWGFSLPDHPGLTASEMVGAAFRGELDTFWLTGGNFLETLPDPPAAAQALTNVRTRVHQDILLSSMMLLPPREAVVLFPATTRYESPGGGTETTTERRIIFSPEIPGRRIGSAKPEWEVFSEVAMRVRPELADRVRFSSSSSLREEIGRAVPLYAGIDRLEKEGDSFQWGGPRLYEGGRCDTPDGRARFSPLVPSERRAPRGSFYVSTRLGKQFNSMVWRETDPLTGASRDEILISPEDAQHLHIDDGESLRLVSNVGT